MSNETEQKEVFYKQQKKLGTVQAVVECKMASEVEILKVLSSKASAFVLHTEVLAGEVALSGKVMYNLIYLSKENEIESMEYESEFTTKFLNEKITHGMSLFTKPCILDSDLVSVQPKEIKIASVVEIELAGTYEERVVEANLTDSSILLKQEEGKSILMLESKIDSFTAAFDLALKDAPTKVLCCKSAVIIKKATAQDGKALIEGQLMTTLAYVYGVDRQEMRVDCETTDFSEEIALPACTDSSKIEIDCVVKGEKFNLKEKNISTEVQIETTASVYHEKSTNIIADAYSTTNDLNIVYDQIKLSALKDCMFKEARISGMASIELSNFSLRRVLGAMHKNLIVSSVFVSSPGEVQIEGVCSFAVFCETEENEIASIDVELPFQLKERAVMASEGDEVSASVAVGHVYTKHKRHNEIEVDADLKLYIHASGTQEKAYLKAITLGEAKKQSKNALSIYVVRTNEESLWDVAKKLSVASGDILAQNPHIGEMLKENDEIVIYRQKQA